MQFEDLRSRPAATITGDLGAMGTIATRVAAETRYTLPDRQLLAQAAQMLGWSEEEVAAQEEGVGGGNRLTRLVRDFFVRARIDDLDAEGFESLVGSTYGDTAVTEMRPRDRMYFEVLSALVHSLADRGRVVIVGRGGQALLANGADTVHVRVVCDFDERVRRIVGRDNLPLADARSRIERSDRQREAWHRKYFDVNYGSPHLYGLVVNTARLSNSSAARVIVEGVRALEAGEL